MRIVVFADTHTKHGTMKVPDGDVVICCGDICSTRSIGEVTTFISWFKKLPHRYKILIAGNHDWGFQQFNPEALIPRDIYYLCDSYTYVKEPNDFTATASGIKVYGTPWTPKFFDWAFMLPRNEEQLKARVEAIPNNVDILVSHGPPFEILDTVPLYDKWGGYLAMQNEGCKMLRQRVFEVKPKLHVFGHIHEGRGSVFMNGTLFVNATICNGNYDPIYKPVVIDYINGIMSLVEA